MEAIGETGEIDVTRTRPLAELKNGYTYFADGDLVFAKVTPCFENGKGALIEGLRGGCGFGTTTASMVGFPRNTWLPPHPNQMTGATPAFLRLTLATCNCSSHALSRHSELLPMS